MLEGINNREYDDYLKYYSDINNDLVKFKILPDEASDGERVINVNLNLFLRILGASSEIIEDDYKTLQFMLYVKYTFDDSRSMRNIFEKSYDFCKD